MKTRSALTTVAALATALVLVPTAAFAQTDTTRTRPTRDPAAARERAATRERSVDEVKARCLAQIDRRQTALSAAKKRLDNSRFLTDAHQAALDANIEATASGLSSLADTIQGDTEMEQLRADCRKIIDDYRVFVLVIPRGRLVRASDGAIAAATRLTGVADRLQSAIDKAKADGKDTSKAEADLAKMKTAIASAKSHASGVYDAVIGLTPADYNANHDVLMPSRTNVRAAAAAIKEAVAAGRATREDLKASNT
ncbi:MAG: hypothetical protein QOF21_1246 [Actinomycetota bacterium]|jgi:hypothetical protein